MKTETLLDHIFILRPMLHLPLWTVMILGYYNFAATGSGWLFIPLLMLIGSGLFGAAFLINQIYDIESDRINKKLHFLPEGYVKIGTAWIMTIILNIIPLLFAYYISFWVGMSSLIITILGILYSVPPIALKNRAWPAAIANGLGIGTIVYALGYCAAGGSFFTALIKSFPYFMAVTAVYVGTTLPDIEGDRETGKLTIGARFGMGKIQYVILAAYLIALLMGIIVRDTPFLIASVIVAPFYFRATYKKSVEATVAAVKVSIISLSLAASYFYPFYLPFLILLIFLTRLYYRARFAMDYPALK